MALEIKTSASPGEFSRFIADDLRKWPPLIRAGNIKAG